MLESMTICGSLQHLSPLVVFLFFETGCLSF